MKSSTLVALLALTSGLALAQNQDQLSLKLCPKIIPLIDKSVDSKIIHGLYEHYQLHDGWTIQEFNYSLSPQSIRRFTLTIETEDVTSSWLSGHLEAAQIYCELPLSWEAQIEPAPLLKTPLALQNAKDTRLRENGTELLLSETTAGLAVSRFGLPYSSLVWFLERDWAQPEAIQSEIKSKYPFITELDVSIGSETTDPSHSVIAMKLRTSSSAESSRGSFDELWWAEQPRSMIDGNVSFFPLWNTKFDDLTHIPTPWEFASRNLIRDIRGFQLIQLQAGRPMISELCFGGSCELDAFHKVLEWHHENLKQGGVLHVAMIFQVGQDSYAKGEYVFNPNDNKGFQLVHYKTFPHLGGGDLFWLEEYRRYSEAMP